MPSGMIVHGIPGSPYVRAALLTLEEKGAVYQLAAMSFGTLKQQPHLSRHPFGRIPAFEHDGWMLYETRAIMRYVDAVVPGPRLQPEEPRAAARMDQLMNITDWYLMPQVSATITFNRVVAPRFNRPVERGGDCQSHPQCADLHRRDRPPAGWPSMDGGGRAQPRRSAARGASVDVRAGARRRADIARARKSAGLARTHRSAPEHASDHLGQAA